MKKIITLFMLLVLTMSASAQTLDKNYFCITALNDNTSVQLKHSQGKTLSHMRIISPGYIDTWTTMTETTTVVLKKGQKLYFKRDQEATLSNSKDYYTFNISDQVNVSGDITTLIHPDGGITDLSEKFNYGVFTGLFYECPIVSA